MCVALARIKWDTEIVGMRANVIGMLPYAPIIVFKNQYKEYNGNLKEMKAPMWSAKIFFKERIGERETASYVSFLVPQAPFEFLQTGSEFELFEGTLKVASGVIIGKADIEY